MFDIIRKYDEEKHIFYHIGRDGDRKAVLVPTKGKLIGEIIDPLTKKSIIVLTTTTSSYQRHRNYGTKNVYLIHTDVYTIDGLSFEWFITSDIRECVKINSDEIKELDKELKLYRKVAILKSHNEAIFINSAKDIIEKMNWTSRMEKVANRNGDLIHHLITKYKIDYNIAEYFCLHSEDKRNAWKLKNKAIRNNKIVRV